MPLRFQERLHYPWELGFTVAFAVCSAADPSARIPPHNGQKNAADTDRRGAHHVQLAITKLRFLVFKLKKIRY